MRINAIIYLSITLAVYSPSLLAMTCTQFNSIGNKANSFDKVVGTPATTRQVQEFKKVIADHVGAIAGFGWFSKRKEALNLIIKKDMLVVYVRESLAITRGECFMRPNESMKEVAIEQFDFMLDALAKKL